MLQYVHSHSCSYLCCPAVVSHLCCKTGAHHPLSAPILTGLSIVLGILNHTIYARYNDLRSVPVFYFNLFLLLFYWLSVLYCYEYLTVITLWSADAEQEAIATAGRGSWQSSNTCGKQCSKNTLHRTCMLWSLGWIARAATSLLRLVWIWISGAIFVRKPTTSGLTTPLLYPALIDRDSCAIAKVTRTCWHIQHMLV